MKSATKVMTQAAVAAATPPKAAKPKPAAKPRSPVAPRSARFDSGTHACAFGTRKYRIYLPSAIGAGTPLPLLVMLHGCGQTPEDFAKGTGMNALAEQLGVIVVYPAQPREAHPNRCWNW
ncbi:PHB depolymerase family esterase, partial [Paracoccus sp. PAMC 22219]|uniref:alpha/beta hydrolase family esterase n=1 Tax=Paracoccus sp. PAMC 22219 TaxID=1569209 RepID=UPI001E295DE6